MVCDLLDFRCIFVNELIGSVVLSMILLACAWFVFSSKIKLGFRATIIITIPLLLIASLAITEITIINFFVILFIGILLGKQFIDTFK